MYCGRCGAAIPEDCAFCPQCGAKVAAPAQSFQDPAAEDPAVFDASVAGEYPPPNVPPSVENTFDTNNAANAYAASDAFPAGAESAYASEDVPSPPKRKRKRKRLILSLIAAVLVLALVAGGLVYALVLSKPEVQILWALKNTGEEFEELWERCDNLNNVASRTKELMDAGKRTWEFEFSLDTEWYPVSYRIRIDDDQQQKQRGGSFDFSSDEVPMIQAQFYIDEEKLVFTLPELLEDAYSVPTKDFGKKLLDSPLGDLLGLERTEELESLSLDPFSTDASAPSGGGMEALLELLVFEKTDRQIPNINSDLTVYRITMDWDAFAQKLKDSGLSNTWVMSLVSSASFNYEGDTDDVIDKLVDEIEDLGLELLIGVNDDRCATAFSLYSEKEDSEITLLLCGKENIWNDIELIVDGETAATASCERTNNGFLMEIEVDGDSLLIECDDRNSEFILTPPHGDSITLRYAEVDGGADFNADMSADGENISIAMRLLPLDQVDRLSDEPIDIFSMSKTKLQLLVVELYRNLQSLNP